MKRIKSNEVENMDVYLDILKEILKQRLLTKELEEIDLESCRTEAAWLTNILIKEAEKLSSRKQQLLVE